MTHLKFGSGTKITVVHGLILGIQFNVIYNLYKCAMVGETYMCYLLVVVLFYALFKNPKANFSLCTKKVVVQGFRVLE